MMNTLDSDLIPGIDPILHLVRHGRIRNYDADQPLTAEGKQESLNVGRDLSAQIRPGETINVFSSPSRRARQTAGLLYDGLSEALSGLNLAATVTLTIGVDDRLQNCQTYLDGLSYDSIKPLCDVARWRLQQKPSSDYQISAVFQTEFWNSPDPIGYWLTYPSVTVESPEAVAGRVRSYIEERLIRTRDHNKLRRDICVTHSGNIRAFLEMVFGSDLGEPPFCAMVTVSNDLVHYAGQVGKFPSKGLG